jgi:ketosteroid isomerase-like protein
VPEAPSATVARFFELTREGLSGDALALIADDAVWDVSRNSPEPRTWIGPEGYVAGWREWMRDWESFSVELEQIVPDDHGAVALVVQRGRARRTGIEIEDRAAVAFEVRDGLIVRIEAYGDREAALRRER